MQYYHYMTLNTGLIHETWKYHTWKLLAAAAACWLCNNLMAAAVAGVAEAASPSLCLSMCVMAACSENVSSWKMACVAAMKIIIPSISLNHHNVTARQLIPFPIIIFPLQPPSHSLAHCLALVLFPIFIHCDPLPYPIFANQPPSPFLMPPNDDSVVFWLKWWQWPQPPVIPVWLFIHYSETPSIQSIYLSIKWKYYIIILFHPSIYIYQSNDSNGK